MIDNPKRMPVNVVAIVPARGGQQSIPYKNLQKLGDKTLLEWAIEVAMAAEKVDAVIVSTEDEKIKAGAEKLGAKVAPRPEEYSQPTSDDSGWYYHAVTWMGEELGWEPELLVNLRPTGPLRFPEDVDAIVDYMLQHPDVDGVKSVIPAPIHPYKMWQFSDKPRKASPRGRGARALAAGEAGPMESVYANDYRKVHGPDQPRQKIQELFPVYWQDAQIDVTRRKFVLRKETLELGSVWGPNIHGYVLDARSVVDIDTLTDLHEAERIYETLRKERGRE